MHSPDENQQRGLKEHELTVSPRVVPLVASLGFLVFDVLLYLLYLHHVDLLSVFPFMLACILGYHFVRGRLPSLKWLACVGLLYQACISAFSVAMATLNGVGLVAHQLLEPLYFVTIIPLVYIPYKVTRQEKRELFLDLVLLLPSIVFILVAFASMLPGNPFIAYFSNDDGQFVLVDNVVPADAMRSLFIFFYAPVILATTSFFSVVIVVAGRFLNVRIKDREIYLLISCVLFSPLVFSLPVAWALLSRGLEKKGKGEE